ncbi:Uncharacterised protein [Achromobacter xylosoxidans]|nr:Uncharacterised protein [Achromobacter xylosoxidans]
MAEPVTVRSLPATMLTRSPLSTLPASRVMRSSLTVSLLLLRRKPFFSACSRDCRVSLSVLLAIRTSCRACRARSPCSLCSVLAFTAISPVRATIVMPSWPLSVLPVASLRDDSISRQPLVLPSRVCSTSRSVTRRRALPTETSLASRLMCPCRLSTCAPSSTAALPASTVTPLSPLTLARLKRCSSRWLSTEDVLLPALSRVVLVVEAADNRTSPPACKCAEPPAATWLPCRTRSRPAVTLTLLPAFRPLPCDCCHSPMTCAIRWPAVSMPERVRLPMAPEITSTLAVWRLCATPMSRLSRAFRFKSCVASSLAPRKRMSPPLKAMSVALMLAWRNASCRLLLIAR